MFRGRRGEASGKKPGESPTLPSAGTWAQVARGDAVVDVVVVQSRRAAVDVTVARAEGADLLEADAEVSLAWPSESGLLRVEATCEDAGGGTWRLLLGGVASTEQRRTYIRVPATVRAHLRGDRIGSVRTNTADLSETGMRCELEGTVPVEVGDRISVSLMLDAERIGLDALVRRVVPGSAATEVALSFVEPYPAETIGRWLVQTQLRLRAAERDGT